MTTTTNTYLRHQVTVNSVVYSVDTPTRINIKKRKEIVKYRTLSTQDNINITYALGANITPNNNLQISDKSTSLVQNRLTSTNQVTTLTTSALTLSVSKFLVTDVYTADTPTQPETPLFYVHTLEYYNDGLSNFDNLDLLSIEFTDYTLNTINISEYYLDSDTGKVYNNIENTYDEDKQSVSLGMIKYTVRSTSGSTQSINVYHELVNNSPVFEQAEFDDVDELGILLTGRKKYTVEEFGGQIYIVTLPERTQYSYKEISSSRIKVLNPTALSVLNPWNVRITNGSFITSLQKTALTYVNHKYYIPEFDSQSFDPYPPYSHLPEQQAIWIYDNIIYTSKNIAYSEYSGLHLDIIVKDYTNTLKYAYTTDPNRIGSLYSGSTYYTDGILSVDQLNGFIEVTDTLRTDDKIFVSYYTEEEEYLFTDIDFNPANNLNNLVRRVIIYINPETSSTGTLTKTLYYLIVGPDGRITYSSQADDSYTDTASQKLRSEDFYNDGTPRADVYYDTTSTDTGLNTLGYSSEFSFVDKYTVDSVLLSAATFPTGNAATNYQNNPRFLILADIYVGESESPKDLSLFDVRTQGGGIKSTYKSAAINQQGEVSWYWDHNAKRLYPSVGAFMIEVPQTITTSHGGNFTTNQINSIIDRHMQAGGYAVLKTYGIDPAITTSVTTSGTVMVGWPSYGSDVTYNVYYSPSLRTGFSQVNTSSLADLSSGNEYTISGLTASTKYYIKIGAIDSDEDESFGTTIAATTDTTIA